MNISLNLADAENYVNDIYTTISKIPELKPRKTKNPRHGQFYIVHKVKNKRTQYFITFDVKNDVYLVRNIITSHESAYPRYIRGIR